MCDFVIENFLKIIEIGAAVVIAFATVVLARLTKQLARESQASREDAKKPRLSAKLKPNPDIGNFIDIVISNVGKGVALNVEFRLEGDEKDFESYNMTPFRGTGSPVNFLSSGEFDAYPLGPTHSLITDSVATRLKPFGVKIKYQDIDGKQYEESCQMDVRQFDGLVWAEHSVAWRQMRAVEKLAESEPDRTK